MSDLDYTYDVGTSADIFILDPANVTSSEIIASCPPVVFQIVNTLDGSAIDSDLFTYKP